jgi:hypothetical protein
MAGTERDYASIPSRLAPVHRPSNSRVTSGASRLRVGLRHHGNRPARQPPPTFPKPTGPDSTTATTPSPAAPSSAPRKESAPAARRWAGRRRHWHCVTVWLLGLLPLYLRSHSFGDFSRDWNWPGAWQRAGLATTPSWSAAFPIHPRRARACWCGKGIERECGGAGADRGGLEHLVANSAHPPGNACSSRKRIAPCWPRPAC